MEYKEVYENLFDVDEEYALAHCISLDCEMGAGIAKQFQTVFPEMKSHIIQHTKYAAYSSYSVNIKYKAKRVGDVITYRSPEGRAIFNLITKDRYYHKPTYSSFKKSIRNLKSVCSAYNSSNLPFNAYGIKKLAIPLLGAGLDGLDWEKNREIIKDIFKDTDIEILVCKIK